MCQVLCMEDLSLAGIGTGLGIVNRLTFTRWLDLLRISKNYRIDCSVAFIRFDDEWRTLGNTGQPLPIVHCLVFLNGALHWISLEGSTLLLCYFDVEKEQCGNLPLPNLSGSSQLKGASFHLGVVDNCLYICDEQKSPLPVNKWVMKDNGNIVSWTLEWIIKQPLPRGLDRDLKPIKTLEDGTVLIIVREKTLASYNPVVCYSECYKVASLSDGEHAAVRVFKDYGVKEFWSKYSVIRIMSIAWFWVGVDEEDNMKRSKGIARQNTSTAAVTALPNPTVTLSDLPNHIVCDILSRLPLNSISTCKRVCKAWRDLTLEPCFAKLHLSRFPLSLIFYHHGTANSLSHFEILQLRDHGPTDFGRHCTTMKFTNGICFPHKRIHMVASCNGLILLANYPSRDLIIVCNPLRAQHFILPKPQKLAPPMHDGYFGFGFGHCTETDQYKVLRYIITDRPTRLLDIDIYTLGIDDEWRSLGDTAQPPAIFTSNLVFLNGALHWMGFQDSWLICFFDIEKEQFGSFPLPSHIGDACKYLGVVDNWLYIRNEPFGVHKFWMMKDYGAFGSWTLECVVEILDVQGLRRFVEPLKFLKDGSLLMTLHECTVGIYRNGPKEDKITLASYNPQTRVLKNITHRGILLWGTQYATYAYVPCFFSPMDALT
ncbi:hypothetical protein RHMOL_Rhmol04G0067300 [Rhododendron molle]|uniref:Uncharacterized protein n=1 Tax=Rhododendron molle TaxID=49168 RepID=A0ACC0NZ11_RHOML|nr:hypothetical protein RHMOL_Rhmol04G0067300 [Rhododendron molle]